MESYQQSATKIERKRVHENLKCLLHFSFQIPLPETVLIYQYTPKHKSESKSKKKIKGKFQKFIYYRDNQGQKIHKVLFLDNENYIDQGDYPFTEPQGKIKNFNQLNVKRLKTTEAAYIGHKEDEIIIKKIQGVKIGQNGTQFETIDDEFQMIKLGNQRRFNQFIKLMSLNKNSVNMSIRVIIDQTSTIESPKIIDFEFFNRQKQLFKKNVNKINQ